MRPEDVNDRQVGALRTVIEQHEAQARVHAEERAAHHGEMARVAGECERLRAEVERLTGGILRAHHAVRQYGPRCSHPECDDLAPLRCDDCGRRFCEAHDDGCEGHDESAGPLPHAVGPDDLRAGSAMREAGSR